MTFLWAHTQGDCTEQSLERDCLGWQSLAGLCCVVHYWKPELSISGMGRGEDLWDLACLYDHSLQSQQPSSTCEVCAWCVCMVCVCVCAGVWAALGMAPRASYILTKLSTPELHSQLPMDRIPFHCPGWSWNSSCSSNRPTSHDPPASASQVAGTKGLHYQV